ncbi:MAG: ribose-phosphate pyrophosphokinase [Chloroflexi bacterium]|nr:ribose-phosphate pyrophosphokinase [Chloroflexota bacterium]
MSDFDRPTDEGPLRLFSGNSNEALAQRVAQDLGSPLGQLLATTFANGETRIRIEENVRGADVFVMQSAQGETVDHSIMELLVMIDALRRASARRITAVMPYLPYARQEKKTAGREPITAKLVANLITTAGANRVLTIDMHAPAIEGFFDIPVDHLRAAPLLAQHFMDLDPDQIVVVSPDVGGVERANKFRQRLGAPLAIVAKQRLGPDATEVVEMVGEVRGKIAILVDDQISTGSTLVGAAAILIARGATEVRACATHGLFPPGATEYLCDSPLEEIVVTDTLPFPFPDMDSKFRTVSVAPMLAEAILRIHENRSVSALFD